MQTNSLFQYLNSSALKKNRYLLIIALFIHLLALSSTISYNTAMGIPSPYPALISRTLAIIGLIILYIRVHHGKNQYVSLGVISSLFVTAIFAYRVLDHPITALFSIYSSLILINIFTLALFSRRYATSIIYILSLVMVIYLILTRPVDTIVSIRPNDLYMTVFIVLTFTYFVLMVEAFHQWNFTHYIYNLVYKTLESGLYNDHMLKVDVDAYIQSSHPFQLVFIKLTNYDRLNKHYQYKRTKMAQIDYEKYLRQQLTESLKIYRIKDDEYVLLSKDRLSDHDFQQLFHKNLFFGNDIEHFVFQGLGIQYPEDGESLDELVEKIYTMQFTHHYDTHSVIHWYDLKNFNEALRKKTLQSDIEESLDQQHIFMIYQPIVNSKNHKIEKVELLSRWHHHQYGPIPPIEFIPIIETMGLLSKLTTRAFTEGIQLYKNYLNETGNSLVISVNISTRTLMNDTIQSIIDTAFTTENIYLKEYFLLEITEDLLVEVNDEVLLTMLSLKEQGFKIAIDDFGTGFSNFEYLQNLEIDILKIDKKFIDGIVHDEKSKVVTNAIITMSHTLNLEVVAEGVEYAEQSNQLEQWQCDYLQGYYFAKPMSEEDLIAYSKQLLHS